MGSFYLNNSFLWLYNPFHMQSNIAEVSFLVSRNKKGVVLLPYNTSSRVKDIKKYILKRFTKDLNNRNIKDYALYERGTAEKAMSDDSILRGGYIQIYLKRLGTGNGNINKMYSPQYRPPYVNYN